MITVCAWCPGNGREPAILGDDGQKDAKVSHGICMPCSDALVEEELEELEGDGLDPLDFDEDDDNLLDFDEDDDSDFEMDYEDDDEYIDFVNGLDDNDD